MSQIEIIKKLVREYQQKEGNLDPAAATIYVLRNKPPELGHTNELIVRTVLREIAAEDARKPAELAQPELSPPSSIVPVIPEKLLQPQKTPSVLRQWWSRLLGR